MGARFSSTVIIPSPSSSTQVQPIGYTPATGFQDLVVRSLGVGVAAPASLGIVYLASGGTISSPSASVGNAINIVAGSGTGSSGGDLLVSGGSSVAASGGSLFLRPGAGIDTSGPGAIFFTLYGKNNGGGTQPGTLAAATFQGNYNNLSGTSSVFSFSPTFADGGTNSSGTMRCLYINPTVNYTAGTKTGSVTALQIDQIETSNPTGVNYLIRARAGAAGTTDTFRVYTTGQVSAGYSGPTDGSSIFQHTTLTSGSLNYVMSLFSSTPSFAQGTGAGLAFGSLTDGSNLAQNGGIYSYKTNGTSGNHASDLCIATNNNGNVVEAVRWTSAQHTQIPSGSVYGISSSSTNAAAADTGISRVSAAVVAIGNGTAADVTATVRAAVYSAGNGTAGAPSHAFTANTDRGIFNDTANSGIGFSVGGTQRATMTAGVFQLFSLNMSLGGVFSTFNGTSTFGMGVPAIYSTAAITAQTSNANICSLSVPAAGDYEVSATLNVTAAASLSTSIECTYTDTASNARTVVLPLQIAGGTGGTYLANGLATATGDYTTPVHMIRVAAGSTITLRTASGTFTTVTYSASGSIKRTR